MRLAEEELLPRANVQLQLFLLRLSFRNAESSIY